MKVESIDLTQKPKSFASYLVGHIKNIHRMTSDEIIAMIKSAKENGVNVSDAYLDKVLTRAEELKNDKSRLMKYIADIVLKGADLGVVSSSEVMQKLSSIYGTRDELIVAVVLSNLQSMNNIKELWEKSNQDLETFERKIKPYIDRRLKDASNLDINELKKEILEATNLGLKINFDGEWSLKEQKLQGWMSAQV
jgi:hypothetical protein